MNRFPTLGAALALAASIAATLAFKGNTDRGQTFYDLLSDPGSSAQLEAIKAATSADCESIGDSFGKARTRDEFMARKGGFAQLMPDLYGAVQALHVAGDFVTMRSRAIGTPVASFFGADGQGRSFDILTIDIHELKYSQIIRTCHV